jgi:hypothetical protein
MVGNTVSTDLMWVKRIKTNENSHHQSGTCWPGKILRRQCSIQNSCDGSRCVPCVDPFGQERGIRRLQSLGSCIRVFDEIHHRCGAANRMEAPRHTAKAGRVPATIGAPHLSSTAWAGEQVVAADGWDATTSIRVILLGGEGSVFAVNTRADILAATAFERGKVEVCFPDHIKGTAATAGDRIVSLDKVIADHNVTAALEVGIAALAELRKPATASTLDVIHDSKVIWISHCRSNFNSVPIVTHGVVYNFTAVSHYLLCGFYCGHVSL